MKARWPVVIAVCGVLAVSGLVFAYWDRVDHATVDARHAAALRQLRSGDADERIRGVQALELVTHDSPGDQPAVTTELSSFIRSHAASSNCHQFKIGRDVQEALNALIRRNRPNDRDTIVDLHGSCLHNAKMPRIELVYANLAGADFDGADLSWSVLDGADLTGANLADANLSYAHVVDARLSSVNLTGANVVGMNTNYSR